MGSVKKFALLFALAAAPALLAQEVSKPLPLQLAADYACFREGDSCRLEIYYSVSSNELALSPADSETGGPGKYLAYVLANADLFTAEGKAVDSLSKTTIFRIPRTDTTYEFSDLLSFRLPPGTYRAGLELGDIKSGRVGRDTVEIAVPDLLAPGLSFSSLELARLITDKSRLPEASYYQKGGRLIVPNPPATYSLDDPRLYFYAELYGLAPTSEKLKHFDLQYAILNDRGDTLKSSGYRKQPKEDNPAVSGSVDLSSMPAGEYRLLLAARDPATGKTALRDKNFWLYPPSLVPPVAVEELEYFPKVAYYLMTYRERAVFQSCNRTGKLNFIDEWWKAHDPSPGTPENEYKDEAYRRYRMAVARYSSSPSAQDGWQTDRGRVLIVYGDPSTVEQSPASPGNLPWEKWDYDRIASGQQALFVFADLRGLGNYRLVHSTAPGEKRNPEWESLLQQNLLRR